MEFIRSIFRSVKEAKSMWKKAKDSLRYLQAKGNKDKGKSGDAAPDVDDDTEAPEEDTLDDDMGFLIQNAAVELRDTASIGGASSFADQSFDGEAASTSSNYSYAAGKKKSSRGDGDALEAAQLLSNTITSYFEKKGEKSQNDGLKYECNWKQIEQMYQHLDEDTILDLNFKFTALTHDAVVAARKKK